MIQHYTLDVKTLISQKSFPADGFFISDITGEIARCLEHSKIKDGIVAVQSLHTTMALAINENELGLTTHDFPDMLRKIAPMAHGEQSYEHDDLDFRKKESLDPNGPERENGHSHCRALLLPHSVQIIVKDGSLRLGTWQRILLFELDGNDRKDRKLALLFMGEP
ncbi:MAG: YjbQ family protein [Parcubacteria group bacterium]|nr:YjbQ family protein [Parcubacteria group bacterium]